MLTTYTNDDGLRDVRAVVATDPGTPRVGRWVGWILGLAALGGLIGVLARVPTFL